MSQTITDISVGDTWVNLNASAGLLEGDPLGIQNKSPTWILLQERTASPTADSKDGTLLGNMDGSYATATVAAGSLNIWAKCTYEGKTATVNVQAL